MRPVMKKIKSLGEKEISVQQFRSGNQGECLDRGVINARVVRAEVQTLSFDMCCSQRVTTVNVDLARVDGVYYVVGTEKNGYVLTLSSGEKLPSALACPCCGARKEAA